MQKNRKRCRLPDYDYSQSGACFITICTKGRRKILSEIVGADLPGGPQIRLTAYGQIADKHIRAMNEFYDHISVDRYVIMPDHIHLLLQIHGTENGPPRTVVPTKYSAVSLFVGTLKRFCNREYGMNIWQSRSYDHVIRGEQDYQEIWTYIENNPAKWYKEHFYDCL